MSIARAPFGTVAVCALSFGAACSGAPQSKAEGPTVSFEHELGEGKNDDEATARSPGSKSAARTPDDRTEAERRELREVPDPEPLSLESQWEYQLAYDAGEVRVTSVNRKQFEKPVPTVRRFGRFAIELWIGRELVDRVRFDFPLIHTHSVPPGGGQSPISLTEAAHSKQTVLVPASPRATRAVLVDSNDGEIVKLAWPPDRPMGPDAAGD